MQFQPSLAKLLGSSDRAIVLQQIHYWMERSGREVNGKNWVFNTIGDWENQFTWMSESTVKRTLKFLTEENFLITGNFNKQKFDKTKWYTIDYERLNNALSQSEQIDENKTSNRIGQFDLMEESNVTRSEEVNLTPSEEVNLNRPIPLDYQEITQETTTLDYEQESDDLIDPLLAKKMMKRYNERMGKQYSNAGLFSPLANQGVSKQEFDDVLSWVLATWRNPDYLSPKSLNTKFEQYLDDAHGNGFIDGKKPTVKRSGEKQEPKMTTNQDVQQEHQLDNSMSTEDMMALLGNRKTRS